MKTIVKTAKGDIEVHVRREDRKTQVSVDGGQTWLTVAEMEEPTIKPGLWIDPTPPRSPIWFGVYAVDRPKWLVGGDGWAALI